MTLTGWTWMVVRKSCGTGRHSLLLLPLAAWALLIPIDKVCGQQDESRVRPIASSNQPIAVDSSSQDVPQSGDEGIPAVRESATTVVGPGVPTEVRSPAGEAEVILVRRATDAAHREPFRWDDQRPWYRNSVMSLAIVLVLVAATLWGLRRLVPSLRHPVTSDAIRVVARTALTPRHQLALVECGDRTLLIGVSPDRLHALGEIGSPARQSGAVAGHERETNSISFGGSDGFDQLLETERRSYVQPPVDRSARQPSSDRSRQPLLGAAVRGPLKELLDRVRALKM